MKGTCEMLRPEVIEKLKKDQEELQYSILELPLYLPEIIEQDAPAEEEEKTESRRVVIIDLL